MRRVEAEGVVGFKHDIRVMCIHSNTAHCLAEKACIMNETVFHDFHLFTLQYSAIFTAQSPSFEKRTSYT